MTAAHAGAAVAPDRVDLVHEDDGGSVVLGLFEQVADPRGTDTDEHFNEVGSGDGEERHAGFACDRAGQQGFPGPGRAEQQHTFGDLGAHRLELLRVLEELLDFTELVDGRIGARNVGEGDLGRVLGHHLGFGLAELHDLAAATLHVLHQQEEHDDDQQERQHGRHDGDEGPGLFRVKLDLGDQALVDPVGKLFAVYLGVVDGGELGGVTAVAALPFDGLGAVPDRGDLQLLALEAAVFNGIGELGPGQFFGSVGALQQADADP